MANTGDSKAPIRTVKRVQFGILAPDEIVSIFFRFSKKKLYEVRLTSQKKNKNGFQRF